MDALRVTWVCLGDDVTSAELSGFAFPGTFRGKINRGHLGTDPLSFLHLSFEAIHLVQVTGPAELESCASISEANLVLE